MNDTLSEIQIDRARPSQLTAWEMSAPVETESSALLAVLSRAASDPSFNIEKFERLTALYEKAQERAARAAFGAALAAMQPELPTVDQKGNIVIIEKGGTKVIQSTPYALMADINEAIRPAMAAHGFALSFRIGTTTEGKITVTGILSHRDGHQEETTIPLMHDSTGSKNSVQAIGSSVSYGKRYTAMALLNITSRAKEDHDDDGRAAGAGDAITQEQVETLQQLIVETGSDIVRFCEFMKVQAIPDIPAARFKIAHDRLIEKRNREAKR